MMVVVTAELFLRSSPRCSLALSATCSWKPFIFPPDILVFINGSEFRISSTTGWFAHESVWAWPRRPFLDLVLSALFPPRIAAVMIAGACAAITFLVFLSQHATAVMSFAVSGFSTTRQSRTRTHTFFAASPIAGTNRPLSCRFFFPLHLPFLLHSMLSAPLFLRAWQIRCGSHTSVPTAVHFVTPSAHVMLGRKMKRRFCCSASPVAFWIRRSSLSQILDSAIPSSALKNNAVPATTASTPNIPSLCL
mmetsp:Transcript_57067/g.135508  ORF Transcript_57067/g.135508 Transcript_57067/m.135508 type:complete len:249 (-) Transcript_57067:96-842(-)